MQVTVAAAVPTVWNMVLALLTERGLKLNYLKLAGIGGAAATMSLVEGLESG